MTTCENYGVYAHQQIHHEMYDGAGPASQVAAMVGWRELADRLNTIRHYLDSALDGVVASRREPAADAAVGSLTPLRTWLDEVQRQVNDTRDRIDHQIAGFIKARDSIPELPPRPHGSDWQEYAVIDLFTISDQEAEEAVAAEQQRQARAAMMRYQDATNERIGGVVRFAAPPPGGPGLRISTGYRPGIGPLPADAAGAALAGTEPAPTEARGGTALTGPKHSAGRSLVAASPPSGSVGSGRIDQYPAGIGPHGPGRARLNRIGTLPRAVSPMPGDEPPSDDQPCGP